MSDSTNFYLLNLNGTDGNITPVLYTRIASVLTTIQAGDVQNLDLNSWYPVRISHRGSRIKVWVDNEKVIEGTDATWTGKPLVGIQNTWDTQKWGPFTISR